MFVEFFDLLIHFDWSFVHGVFVFHKDSGKFWFLFSCFNFTKIEKEQSFCEKRNSKANIEGKQLFKRDRNSE